MQDPRIMLDKTEAGRAMLEDGRVEAASGDDITSCPERADDLSSPLDVDVCDEDGCYGIHVRRGDGKHVGPDGRLIYLDQFGDDHEARDHAANSDDPDDEGTEPADATDEHDDECYGIHLGADGEHRTCDGRPI